MHKTHFSPAAGFNWDSGNVNKNRLKHGVDKNECEEVFFNPRIILNDVKHSTLRENRYLILGITNKERKLTIAITIRDKQIRVVMARDQSKKERTFYNNKYPTTPKEDKR
jgi:uncharacterized DUF497 family protein